MQTFFFSSSIFRFSNVFYSTLIENRIYEPQEINVHQEDEYAREKTIC